jgi:hypothetical protein
MKDRAKDEVLQACWRRIESGESVESIQAQFPDQVETMEGELIAAAWLRQRREIFEPRPGYINASRGRLLAKISQLESSKRSMSKWQVFLFGRRRLSRKVSLVLQFTLALLLLVSAGMSVDSLARAAHTWLPGDSLYPLKTAAERLQLALTPGAAWDARLHIEFAQRRLMEIQALSLESSYEQIPSTVVDFGYHVDQAVLEVNQVAGQDRQQAQTLANQLQIVLSKQGWLVDFLARYAPQHSQADYERVRYISEVGFSAMQDIYLPGSGDLPVIGASTDFGTRAAWARREVG